MNSALIFGLLIALMLTGMPISIALGLTVLSFLFVMTQVPIEAVALKLFTGIESFEIMAIPFFILAGNFLTHGGVARRMIAFATSMVGHWPRCSPARCLLPFPALRRPPLSPSAPFCCRRWSPRATRSASAPV